MAASKKIEQEAQVEQVSVEQESVEQESVEQNVELDVHARELKAGNIIKNHMIASLGFSVIPMPVVDLVGVMGTQLNMLRKLSHLYGQEFKQEWGKKSVASLLGGGLSVPIATGFASLVKFIPVIGQAAGVVSMATTSAALTYAVGKVFTQHFELGGTLLTFDADKVREYFKSEFEKGKDIAQNMKKAEKATA